MYSLGAVGSACAYAGSMINMGSNCGSELESRTKYDTFLIKKSYLKIPSKLCMKQGSLFARFNLDLHDYEVKFDSSSVLFCCFFWEWMDEEVEWNKVVKEYDSDQTRGGGGV